LDEPKGGARGAAGRMAVRFGTWATVDGGTKTSGPGAMDADGLCVLRETTSLFA
jgi:hypothetical protein